MLKKLTKNIGLKLASLLIAFVLWLIVVNYADPVGSTTYSGVRVELLNGDKLLEKGKVYEVINNTNVIDVEIRASRSVLETLSYENIRAVADMEELSYLNNVKIQVYTNKSNDQLDSIWQSRDQLELSVENLKEIPMTVNIAATGEPAEGYVMGNISQNQNSVRVSGPESVVNTIAKAECSVSVAGRTSDLSTSADINLYDKDGNIVKHDNLKTNITTINVGVEILPYKTVSVNYNISGKPEEGYTVSAGPTADCNEVTICGRSNILNGISQLTVPAAEISVDGENATFTKTLNLKEYLPDGIRLVPDEESGFDGTVNVSVKIEKLVEKDISVPIRNLMLSNLPDGFDGEVLLLTDGEGGEGGRRLVNLVVKVRGVEKDISGVDGKKIKGSIDVGEFLESHNQEPVDGIFQIEVELGLPDGVEATEKYYVDVRLTKIVDL